MNHNMISDTVDQRATATTDPPLETKPLPSLRTSLVRSLFLATALPLLLIGGLSFYRVSQQTQETLQIKNELLAATLANQLEQTLDKPQLLMDELARVMLDYSADPYLWQVLLDGAVQDSDYFESIQLLNRGGRVDYLGLNESLEGTRQQQIGVDLSDRPFIQLAQQANQQIWSDSFHSPLSRNNLVSLAQPLRDKLLIANLATDSLFSATEQIPADRCLHISLIDRSGVLLNDSRKALAGLHPNISSLDPVRTGLRGKTGSGTYFMFDQQWFGSTARIPQTGWLVMVSQNETEVFATSRELLLNFMGGLLLSGTVALIAAALYARRLAQPLQELSSQAAAVADGDYRVNPGKGRHRELQLVTDGFAGMARVVEQRERDLNDAWQEQRLLTEQFQALFNGIPDGLLLVSRTDRILWANRGAEQIFGQKRMALLEQDAETLIYDSDQSSLDNPIQSCFASGDSGVAQTRKKNKRILSLRTFPIGQPGRVKQVILLAQDITTELQAQQEQLRTGQLAALGELAASVAHEINNPVNGIINYAQILASHAEKVHDSCDFQERIIKEGNRIAAIVSSLLSFARKKDEKGLKPVLLHELLSDTLTLVRTHLRKDGIRLELELDPDLPPLAGRGQQLQQVFLNLISNARFALNQKFPGADANQEKELKIVATLSGSDEIELTFRDAGSGIEAAVIEQVCAPFFTTKAEGEGTGLGLSITRRIVEEHHGRLEISSKPGEYTAISLFLKPYQVPAAA